MNYYELQTPQQWQAGKAGTEPNQTTIYFDCADCGAKEPLIKGFLGSGPAFNQIGVITTKSPRGPFNDHHLAMFCAPCFDKRVNEAQAAAA